MIQDGLTFKERPRMVDSTKFSRRAELCQRLAVSAHLILVHLKLPHIFKRGRQPHSSNGPTWTSTRQFLMTLWSRSQYQTGPEDTPSCAGPSNIVMLAGEEDNPVSGRRVHSW